MVEKAKSLAASQAKRAEYGEAGKYVNFLNKEGKQAKVTINQGAIDKDLQFAGYNLLVTSEIDMSDMDMYNIYHNLWRIEESFKIMKSDLDARPVFLQKEETIKGHFLICYLTVLLERIFQFKILENKYSTNEIFRFIKDFKVTKAETKYINTATSSRFINDLSEMLRLPLTNYFLPEKTYLNDWMKVSQIIRFFKDFYADFIPEKAYDMLKRLNIDPNSRLKTLSKGTKEKVQLILVMSRDAQLYLLDEPIGGVDPAARDYILDTIISNYNENAAVILSTHLIADIEKVLDDIIFLKEGQIVLNKTVDEVRDESGKSVDALFREVFKC
jgi:ABC-type sugar transport system ATPase subunit